MDIEQLQQTFFRESQQSRSLSTANDLVEKRLQTLTKAVDDIRAAGEKMRTERLRVLNEFREKINEYEQILQKNDILLQFVEKWRENAENNRDLIAFPGIIQNLAHSLSHFYKIDLTGTLENIAENAENAAETKDMEIKKKNTAVF
uniref:Uncharacterized protein n=1 Tax=Schistocephalus solidus TaxID=70667 RepID=A0A0X3PBP4_SCHSO